MGEGRRIRVTSPEGGGNCAQRLCGLGEAQGSEEPGRAWNACGACGEWGDGGRGGRGTVRTQSCCVKSYDLYLVGSRNPLKGFKWVCLDQIWVSRRSL